MAKIAGRTGPLFGDDERILGTVAADQVIGDPYTDDNGLDIPGNGRTLAIGRGGHDWIQTFAGDDTILGDAARIAGTGRGGDDLIDAGAGDDLVAGDAERIRGQGRGGNDRILAGDGNDILAGDFGVDLGSAARGVDVFRLGRDSGLDQVLDLEIGKDLLDFRGFGGDPNAVIVEQVGTDLIVDLDGTAADLQEVLLVNVTLAAYQAELGGTILF